MWKSDQIVPYRILRIRINNYPHIAIGFASSYCEDSTILKRYS